MAQRTWPAAMFKWVWFLSEKEEDVLTVSYQVFSGSMRRLNGLRIISVACRTILLRGAHRQLITLVVVASASRLMMMHHGAMEQGLRKSGVCLGRL